MLQIVVTCQIPILMNQSTNSFSVCYHSIANYSECLRMEATVPIQWNGKIWRFLSPVRILSPESHCRVHSSASAILQIDGRQLAIGCGIQKTKIVLSAKWHSITAVQTAHFLVITVLQVIVWRGVDVIVTGKCRHSCHLHCMSKWLQSHDTCPECRSKWAEKTA